MLESDGWSSNKETGQFIARRSKLFKLSRRLPAQKQSREIFCGFKGCVYLQVTALSILYCAMTISRILNTLLKVSRSALVLTFIIIVSVCFIAFSSFVPAIRNEVFKTIVAMFEQRLKRSYDLSIYLLLLCININQ